LLALRSVTKRSTELEESKLLNLVAGAKYRDVTAGLQKVKRKKIALN